ncbi:MAG: hypothetical protein IT529_08835 [Burkholderiales bacterium]|nr:hypothetical protein [Burkholderiales bacterium]
MTTDDSGLHAHPQSDFDCTELTAAAGPVPVATVPGERGIEPAPAIPATASEFPQGANSVRSRLSPVLPPGVRVYLGTLRLRI